MDTTREVELLEPGAMMRRVLRDAARVLDDRPASAQQEGQGSTEPQGAPPMAIFEREGCLIVRVDLPGLEKGDVSVTVTGEALAIDVKPRGDVDEERQDASTPAPTEGKFLRTIGLPEGIDAAAVTAMFADGVLELTVPLPAKAPASASALTELATKRT